MRKILGKSFRRQLLLSLLLSAVLPMLLSGTFLISLFQLRTSRDYARKDRERLRAFESRFEGLLSEEDHVMRRIAAQPVIQGALENGFGSRSQIYRILYEESGAYRELARFDLYSHKGVCQYSTGSGMYERELPTYWGILRAAAVQPDSLQIGWEEENGGTVLRLCRSIEGSGGILKGYILLTMQKSDFDEMVLPIVGGQDGLCILNRFLEPVYYSGGAETEAFGKEIRERVLAGRDPEEDFREQRVCLSTLGESGLRIALLRPLPFSGDTVRSMYRISLLLSLFSLLLCILVSGVLSARLFYPIRELQGAMARVRRGELQTRIQTGRRDEFGELAESFNVMTENLDRYMKRQVAQQKELNEVQIAMMQAQLNPHFLYNTLDTIKWMAKAHQAPEIATMSSKLAKILRTSISGPGFIPLREELALAESYGEIQKIRFGGRFEIRCELPEELREIPVPKLIVQPIVENAVLHGFREIEEGRILLRVRRFPEETLEISIADDGCGISEETLCLLRERRREIRKGHIGIYNVDSILRLHYGEKYGLEIRKRENRGTEVRIRIPLQPPEEERHDSGTGGR